MNTYSSNLQELEIKRQRLEQLWKPTLVERVRQMSAHLLHTVGQWLVASLTEGNQLRIWFKETKQGSYWCVHDPLYDQHRQFNSEEALRVWLEQRYSR